MQPKILFILPKTKNVTKLVEAVELINDDIIVSHRFTDNILFNNENIEGIYYLESNTISRAIKNNSILYVSYENNNIIGVTMDDFYNSDIIPLYINNFNDISTNLLDKYIDDLVIVWYDTCNHSKGKELNREILESELLLKKIETHNYKFIYFLDDDFNTVADVLNNIITGSDEDIKKICENYS